MARITPTMEGKCEKHVKRTSMIKDAQTKLRGMKESKGFEHSTKITYIMMLRTR
jgi:hypothetical protein